MGRRGDRETRRKGDKEIGGEARRRELPESSR
jgi:hypothetical protein